MAESTVVNGFNNKDQVLINGEHWFNIENKRNILAYGWIIEFASILFERIDFLNPTATVSMLINHVQRTDLLTKCGPMEKLKYAQNSPRSFRSVPSTVI